MFITKKTINGKDYFYFQKSVRDKDKVKSEYIAYLGKDKEEAEKKAELIKQQLGSKEKNYQKKLQQMTISIDELAAFCKRKGFVYPSGEIYGGLAGFWDFGHLGTLLKNNIKTEWREYHVQERDDIVEIDGSIITNPKVWETSGHILSFSDKSQVNKN